MYVLTQTVKCVTYCAGSVNTMKDWAAVAENPLHNQRLRVLVLSTAMADSC